MPHFLLAAWGHVPGVTKTLLVTRIIPTILKGSVHVEAYWRDEERKGFFAGGLYET